MHFTIMGRFIFEFSYAANRIAIIFLITSYSSSKRSILIFQKFNNLYLEKWTSEEETFEDRLFKINQVQQKYSLFWK